MNINNKQGPLVLNEPSDDVREINRFRITIDKSLASQGYPSRNQNMGTKNVHFLTQLSPVGGSLKSSIQNMSKYNPTALVDITKQKLNNANSKIISKHKPKKLKKSKSKSKNMFIPANKISKNVKVLVKVASNKNLLSNTIKTSSSCASLARKSPKSVRNSENAQFKFSKNIMTLKDNLENIEVPKKKSQVNKNRNLYYELKNAMTESLSKRYNDFNSKRNSLNSIQSGFSKLKAYECIVSNNNSSSRKDLHINPLSGRLSKPQIVSPKAKQQII